MYYKSITKCNEILLPTTCWARPYYAIAIMNTFFFYAHLVMLNTFAAMLMKGTCLI